MAFISPAQKTLRVTLGVAPMMYAIHHPAGAHNRTAWAHDFGYLKTRDIAPVVVGEWANYAAVKSECWKDAPTAVPAFIGYLKKTSIGLNAWTLIKGVLIRSSTNLDDPTHIRANWSCTNGLNEGAGHEIAASFQRRNG